MPQITIPAQPSRKSMLDRALSVFADVRAGEGATAMLMVVNIFLLLICYSVIKTVREPLILLGGGAEMRSYAAAGQALLLMGFVPLYGWFASRVNRARLLVGGTLFFIVWIELFAAAVAARIPNVGTEEQPIAGLELLGLSPAALPVSANVVGLDGEPVTAGRWQVSDQGHYAVYDDPVLSIAAPAFLASAANAPPGTIELP